MMYYQIKSNIMFRNYNNFGYITDNRNYFYKKIYDNNFVVGDKIVSETGTIFLSVLSWRPQEISEIVLQIMNHIPGVGFDEINTDAKEFYDQLEKEGFIVSGRTSGECCQNDKNACKKGIANTTKVILNGDNTNIKVDTQDYFYNVFGENPLLRSLHIEITSFCNERCIHCYIPHEYKNHHMDIELFNKIVDESIDMKLLNFTITGGEPMLHPQFIEIINRCKKENISLNILSNLTLLSEEIITELQANPLISIQTSLYSTNPVIHDGITKVKGSCELTKKAIKTLVDNNINLQISCPIIKQNVHCYLDVIEWAKTMNINVSSDYILLGKYNSDTDNLNCRLDYEDIHRIIKNNNSYDKDYVAKDIEEKRELTLEDNICSVCRYSFCVSEKGNVYPCAGWQSFILGNLYKSKLENIWNDSEKIKYLRNLKIKDFEVCAHCDDRIYCSICLVRNANENKSGDPMKISQYHCDIAHLKKEWFLKTEKII